jgi:hypothetical protein
MDLVLAVGAVTLCLYGAHVLQASLSYRAAVLVSLLEERLSLW